MCSVLHDVQTERLARLGSRGNRRGIAVCEHSDRVQFERIPRAVSNECGRQFVLVVRHFAVVTFCAINIVFGIVIIGRCRGGSIVATRALVSAQFTFVVHVCAEDLCVKFFGVQLSSFAE